VFLGDESIDTTCLEYLSTLIAINVYATYFLSVKNFNFFLRTFSVESLTVNYRIAGMFGEFDDSFTICQTKTIQILLIFNIRMAESSIFQTFICQPLLNQQFLEY